MTISMNDIQYISSRPRILNKIICDDWNMLLRLEEYKLIHSFEGYNDSESTKWIAKLTSHGKNIINTYNKQENIEIIDDLYAILKENQL